RVSLPLGRPKAKSPLGGQQTSEASAAWGYFCRRAAPRQRAPWGGSKRAKRVQRGGVFTALSVLRCSPANAALARGCRRTWPDRAAVKRRLPGGRGGRKSCTACFRRAARIFR